MSNNPVATHITKNNVTTDLHDRRLPSSLGTSDQVLKMNEAGTQIEWGAAGGGDDAQFGTDDILEFIDGTNTAIQANPSGTASESLTKLKIDTTIYSIEGGGGQSASFSSNKLVFTGGTPTLQGYLLVTSLAGATVTVGSDSYTYGAEETSHNFGPYDYGTYTVKANKTGMYEKTVSGIVAAATNACTCIPNRLPSEYQELSYIQSSGTTSSSVIGQQYIDTGVSNPEGKSFSYELKFMPLQGIGCIMGNQNNQTMIYRTGNSVCSNYFGLSTQQAFNWATNEEKVVTASYEATTYLRTITLDEESKSATKVLTTNNDTIKLFANTGYIPGDNGIGRMYYAKITIDNELKFNGIPAKRNSDDVFGMYDTVSSTFFENSGTGTFIPGDPV